MSAVTTGIILTAVVGVRAGWRTAHSDPVGPVGGPSPASCNPGDAARRQMISLSPRTGQPRTHDCCADHHGRRALRDAQPDYYQDALAPPPKRCRRTAHGQRSSPACPRDRGVNSRHLPPRQPAGRRRSRTRPSARACSAIPAPGPPPSSGGGRCAQYEGSRL